MLGSNLELTAYVVLDQSAEEAVVRICHKVVKAYSRTDKDLLNTGNCTHFFKKPQILQMIHLKIRTGLRRKTALVAAKSALFLTVAGWTAEVCRGTADVMNISLKIGQGGKKSCFA